LAEIIAMVTAVQKFLIFPPKNLEKKYGCSKYACAVFFSFLDIFDIKLPLFFIHAMLL